MKEKKKGRRKEEIDGDERAIIMGQRKERCRVRQEETSELHFYFLSSDILVKGLK